MLATILGWLSSGLVGVFGSAIVQPIVNAWLGSQNIDLEKLQATDTSLTTISAAILQANIQYAGIQENYNITILNWFPFRCILFALLFFPAVHFSMAIADNSVVWFFGEPYGWFSVPELKSSFASIENQLLLFFIIAKPVDSAICGTVALMSQYLKKL